MRSKTKHEVKQIGTQYHFFDDCKLYEYMCEYFTK